ncbi:MAG: hypothetical protein ACFFCZ_27335, partial [Promethearchaeota archaeon]
MRIYRKEQCRFISLILLSIGLGMLIAQPLILGLTIDQEESRDTSNKNARSLSQINVNPLTHSGKNFVINSPNVIEKEINLIIREKAIGEQQGEGGGAYTVSDFANITSSNTLDTSNSRTSETRDDSATLNIPNGFRNDSGWFNISSITANNDWKFYEATTTGSGIIDTDLAIYNRVPAMEIKVSHDYANITSISLYYAQFSVNGPNALNTTVYVVNSTASGAPNNTDVLTDEVDLYLQGGIGAPAWSSPLTFTSLTHPLRKDRSYFVVINTTASNSTDHYQIYVHKHDNSGDSNEYTFWEYAGGTWWGPDPVAEYWDILLKGEFLPVKQNTSNHWVA